jgi:PleD family two-component response regulator
MLFESNKKKYYSSGDATLLSKVCNLLSSPIEIVSLNNYINEKVMVDDTGILKPEVMLNKLSIELNRQSDLDISGILVMFSIDKHEEYISKYGVSNFRKILLSIIDIIKPSISVYDVIGKIDDNIIAVYRLALNLDDGKVYAEKIRKLIARNIITTFDTKSFSVTVSIGLVETYKFKSSDSMIDSCKKVLNIAIDEGGNRVKIN